ncbi:hypothetical protein Tco_0407996 [Tanacetum coccineum]
MVQQAMNQVVEILLVIVVEQLVFNMFVDEPLVPDEQLVQSTIDDELVLHMIVVVEEMCSILVVEELSKVVDDTVMDCTEVDDCCSMEVCYRCSWSGRVEYNSAMSYIDSFGAYEDGY